MNTTISKTWPEFGLQGRGKIDFQHTYVFVNFWSLNREISGEENLQFKGGVAHDDIIRISNQ